VAGRDGKAELTTPRLGVRLPATGNLGSATDIVRVARWAEELGYSHVWLSDHIVLPERVDSFYPYDPQGEGKWRADPKGGWLAPLVALTWAAAAAPSIELGTSVLVVPMRNPFELAKHVSSIDHLAGGRVLLGIGAGWMKEEFDLIGVPFESRGRRTVEMVKLMRALWSGEPIDHQGEFWQAKDFWMSPLPPRRAVPILWGGHSKVAMQRVARLGDGWHPIFRTVEQVREGLEFIRRECDRVGRDHTTLRHVGRPIEPFSVEIVEAYQKLGIDDFMFVPPFSGPELADTRRDMERMATAAGLKPRR